MAKYVYPAVFIPEENGYFIDFPDFDSCYTQGNDLSDGMNMAQDVLALMLTHLEDKHQKLPTPSSISDLLLEQDTFAVYISCDTTAYRRLMANRVSLS